MIHKLDQVATAITFVTFDFPRAAGSSMLYEESNHPLKEQSSDWRKTILYQLENSKADEMLLITGSLYFISEVKTFWNNFKK